jgi:hypothetical protein
MNKSPRNENREVLKDTGRENQKSKNNNKSKEKCCSAAAADGMDGRAHEFPPLRESVPAESTDTLRPIVSSYKIKQVKEKKKIKEENRSAADDILLLPPPAPPRH